MRPFLPILLPVVLALFTAHQSPAQRSAWIATSWEVVDSLDAPPDSRVSRFHLQIERSAVENAGWRVGPSPASPSARGQLLEESNGSLRVQLTKPSFVVIPARPDSRFLLDGKWRLTGVKTKSSTATAVLIPAGLHTVTWESWPRLRNGLAFNATSIGPGMIAALVGLLLWWFLRRRPRARIPDPGPQVRPNIKVAALLALLIALSWAWLLWADNVANDYGWAIINPQQASGETSPWLNQDDLPEELVLTSNSPVCRTAHVSLYALELLPFGPNASWLHFIAILYHVSCALVIYILMGRYFGFGKAAFLGALIGGMWPVGGQALAWTAARCLAMAHSFGLIALLFGISFARRGRSRDLVVAVFLVWISAGCKETGLAYGAIVGVVPFLAARAQFSWHRLAALWTGLFLVGVGWIWMRVALGYGLPTQYHGISYRSSLDMLGNAVAHLEYAIKGGFSWSTLEPEHAWWSWGVALALLACTLLRPTKIPLRASGLALLVGLLAQLPDCVYMLSWASPIGGRFYYATPLFVMSLLIATSIHAWQSASRQWMRWLPVALACLLIPIAIRGHLKEAEFRIRMSKVASEWIESSSTQLDKLDHDVLQQAHAPAGMELEGPPAAIIVGLPDRPQKGEAPLLGATTQGYVQPPFATRVRHGESVFTRKGFLPWLPRPTADPAWGRCLPDYPWRIHLLESPGGQAAPEWAGTFPPLSGMLPQRLMTKVLERSSTPDSHTQVLLCPVSPLPAREVGSLMVMLNRPMPAGTRFSMSLQHSATGRSAKASKEAAKDLSLLQLRRAWPKGRKFMIPLRLLHGLNGAQQSVDAITIRVVMPHVAGANSNQNTPGPWLSVRAERELPSLKLVQPVAGFELQPQQRWPVMRIESAVPVSALDVVFSSDAKVAPVTLQTSYRIGAQDIKKVAGFEGTYEIDVLNALRMPDTAWSAGIQLVSNEHPAVSSFWVWAEMRVVLPQSGILQARAEPVPVKIILP